MTVLNPLYVTKGEPKQAATAKNVATARIENTMDGVCPKCKTTMATSQLGQSMGNQKVHFCMTCRVAEPMRSE